MSQPISEMAGALRGRRALVTGGDGEIGRVICATLVADGADVAVAGIDEAPAVELAESLATDENRTAGHQFDATDRDSVRDLVDRITQDWGGVDVLINCIGNMKVNAAEDLDVADWHSVIDTNLTAAFLVSQAVGQSMIKGGDGGQIVHLSSVRGTIGLGIGGFAAYGASKAGVHLLVKQLAAEWGRHQIRVNAVAAGFVRTVMSAAAMQNKDFADMVAARTPLRRIAEIQEVANTAVYLAGPRAGFITGQLLFVDGGLTATQ
jgi:NAD(P)-dependent dehydrogenase (short-subunit alcohol dehydrogenase family)